MTSRRRHRRGGISNNRGVMDRLFASALGLVLATPVVLHLLVELFLCFAGTGIRATASILSVAGTVVAATSTAASIATCVALTRDVSVDMVGGRFAYVAAAAAASSSTATSVSTFGLAFGAHRALHAVEEGAASALAAAGDEGEADWLALCVSAVKFTDRVVCVSQSLVCDEGNALGASSAIINEGKFLDRANSAEEVLLGNVCQMM